MKTAKVMTIMACAHLLWGCATTDDGQYSDAQGWRLGVVQATGTDRTVFAYANIDCRRKLPTTVVVEHRFAYVQLVFDPLGVRHFYSGPRNRHAIVPIPDDMELKPGEQVHLNIRDCNQPIAHFRSSQPQALS